MLLSIIYNRARDAIIISELSQSFSFLNRAANTRQISFFLTFFGDLGNICKFHKLYKESFKEEEKVTQESL
jgi:hypothetical protein